MKLQSNPIAHRLTLAAYTYTPLLPTRHTVLVYALWAERYQLTHTTNTYIPLSNSLTHSTHVNLPYLLTPLLP